jgi:glutathione-regulated potassium-efflux system ancillary protein KefG
MGLTQKVEGTQGIFVSNLYEKYPDNRINIAEEQSLLIQSDLIILQFPFYWFNTTPLLKQWLDEVFLYGFAYGPGDKIKGKDLMLTVTTGGDKARYANDARLSLPELFKPFEYTALYCEMNYQEPFVVSGFELSDEALSAQAQDYADRLNAYHQEGSVALKRFPKTV